MQKVFKRFALIFMALIATLCMAVFAAACTDGEDTNGDNNGGGGNENNNNYATTTITITVLDENGDPVDGTTFGKDMIGDTANIGTQFCCVLPNGELGSCSAMVQFNSEGVAVLDYESVKNVAVSQDTDRVELHILYVEYGAANGNTYKKGYGIYNINEIPAEITVTLELAD